MRFLRRRAIFLALWTAVIVAGCTHDKEAPAAWETSSTDIKSGRNDTQRRANGQVDRISANDQVEVFRGLEETGSGNFIAQRPGTITVPGRSSSSDERVSLNLLNVPLAQAAKSVLADVLKLDYTIAEKLNGSITIQTTTPMRADAVLEAFESALKVNGIALVKSGNIYRVVAASGAAQVGGRVSVGTAAGKFGTQILVAPLKFAAPSEMRRIIEPVSPQGGIVSADDARNLLILSGTSRELADMNAMITLFDVDWMRGMSVALFPLKSSDPEVIARELETVLGLDRDGPLKGTVRIMPNKRLSAIMVISSRPAPIATARKWLEQLDRVAESTEEQLFVYKVRNRNAAELGNLLGRVMNGKDGGSQSSVPGSVAPRFDTALQSNDPQASSAQRNLQSATTTNGLVPTSTATGSASSGGAASSGGNSSISSVGGSQASQEPSQSTQVASSPGRQQRVVADEANSALLITATRKEYDRILRILERMDTLPTQIMIEALIAEVTLNDELKFGVKFALGGRHNVALSDSVGGGAAPNFPGFSYFYLTTNIAAAVDAVSSITKVNVISAPSLMVLDNRKATLQIGDQVPIVSQSAVSTLTTGAPVVNSITLKDTGIILSVIPRVSDSGRVVLEIEQEVSNVKVTTSSGIDSPTIQQRRIRTSVVVGDGQVVALGGLIQERDNKTKSQIPILGDIPIVGAAFRQQNDKIDRTELLIFIRPVVLRNSDDATAVTEEFRRRIHLERPTSQRGRNSYDRDAQRILR